MPSWRGKLTDQQIWQLAAYVRTLSGQEPKDAVSARADELSNTPPQTQTRREPVDAGGFGPAMMRGGGSGRAVSLLRAWRLLRIQTSLGGDGADGANFIRLFTDLPRRLRDHVRARRRRPCGCAIARRDAAASR